MSNPTLIRLILATLTLTGCPPPPPPPDDTGLTDTSDTGTANTDSTDTDEPDADLDGWPWSVDCDDEDPALHPDADELCNEVDDDCDGQIDEDPVDATLWHYDRDGDGFGGDRVFEMACAASDGYVANVLDCDDSDAAISPDATELCNTVDDDCDGDIDEDPELVWYLDHDGDGHGDPLYPAFACEQPRSYVADNLDCDDLSDSVSPDATESCDEIDDDCDGDIDESGGPDWYADADADGYGAGAGVADCIQPSGHVADATDCDDTAIDLHPAATESCNGADDDCDGLADDDDLGAITSATSGVSLFYADADADTYGDPDAATHIYACDNPGGYVRNPDDCDDADATTNPDAAEVCSDGADNDCDGTAPGCIEGVYTPATATNLTGESGSTFGGASVAIADYTGDGTDDLLVGAWYGAGGPGAAYVVAGPVAAGTDLSAAFMSAAGEDSHDWLGAWGLAPGDYDDDGDADLGLVGFDESNHEVSAYVVGGGTAGTVDLATGATLRLEETLTGWNSYGEARVANAGDLDGDGVDDLALGAGSYSNGSSGSYPGRVWILANLDDAPPATLDDGFVLTGEHGGDLTGTAIAGLGDADGDGADDLLIGARTGQDGEGRAYLVSGPVTGDLDLSAADAYFTGLAGSQLGSAAAAAGDLDGDGTRDLLIGAGSGERAYVVSGGVTTSGAIDAIATLTIEPLSSGANFASTLCGDADLDGNGATDLVVSDRNGTSVWIFADVAFSATATATIDTSSAAQIDGAGYARFGFATACRGDTNADGLDDLAVGAPASGASERGEVFLFTAW